MLRPSSVSEWRKNRPQFSGTCFLSIMLAMELISAPQRRSLGGSRLSSRATAVQSFC